MKETCFSNNFGDSFGEKNLNSHHVFFFGILGKRMLAPECGERPGEN